VGQAKRPCASLDRARRPERNADLKGSASKSKLARRPRADPRRSGLSRG
jgi:hypothetical protein